MADNYLEKRMEEHLASRRRSSQPVRGNNRRNAQSVCVVGFNTFTPVLLEKLQTKSFRTALIAKSSVAAVDACRRFGARFYPVDSDNINTRLRQVIEYYSKVNYWIIDSAIPSELCESVLQFTAGSPVWTVGKLPWTHDGRVNVFEIRDGIELNEAASILASVLNCGHGLAITVDKISEKCD